MRHRVRRVHFVGIGGAGMSGLAEILHASGYAVSGSDLRESATTRRLAALGVRVAIGHEAAAVAGADVVVYSSAVRPSNPELEAAQQAHVPVIPRAEMLGELMRMKHGVAISGAHGKTTTTSLIGDVLAAGGLDPTTIVGGRVQSLGANSRLGGGDVLVAEADESDGSFLRLIPTVVVITNIDREHLDHYPDLGAIQDAFVWFLNRVPFYGLTVACVDDPNVRAILPRIDRKRIGYGLSSEAEISATDIEVKGFECTYVARRGGTKLGRIRLAVPGRHSVYNSLAAVAVGLELDVPFRRIAGALAAFRGADRRLQLKGRAHGALILDDYGHHPTEVVATLSAIREGFGARTLVVFQPHRYSRTQALLEDFGRAFFLADQVIVTDVYAAGERPIDGISGASVAESLVRHGHPSVVYERRLSEVAKRLRPSIVPGDVVLTLGAGDVWKVGDALLRSSSAKRRRA